MTLAQAAVDAAGVTVAGAGVATALSEQGWTTPAMVGVYLAIIGVVTLIANTVAGIIKDGRDRRERELERLWKVQDREWKDRSEKASALAAQNSAKAVVAAVAVKNEVASSRVERQDQLTTILNAVETNTQLTEATKAAVESK